MDLDLGLSVPEKYGIVWGKDFCNETHLSPSCEDVGSISLKHSIVSTPPLNAQRTIL